MCGGGLPCRCRRGVNITGYKDMRVQVVLSKAVQDIVQLRYGTSAPHHTIVLQNLPINLYFLGPNMYIHKKPVWPLNSWYLACTVHKRSRVCDVLVGSTGRQGFAERRLTVEHLTFA